MTDYEFLENGLQELDREQALRYWSVYKRYGTSQKNPIDAIFDLMEQGKQEQIKTVVIKNFVKAKKDDLQTIHNAMKKIENHFWDYIEIQEAYEKINVMIDRFETAYINDSYSGIGSLSIPSAELTLQYCKDVFNDVKQEIEKQIKEI